MSQKNSINEFINEESGAVNVDWVVLTAVILGLGTLVMANISTGLTSLSDQVSQRLTDMPVGR